MRSYNPRRASPRGGFGLLPGRSPLLGESFLFSFPPGTKMFQFPGLALPNQRGVAVLQTAGLSHSDIRGSKVICTYPRLVAACHVLHRLCEPRHPPSALNYFPCRTYFRLSHAASAIKAEDSKSSTSFSLQSCLCQHVKDLLKGGRRMGGERNSGIHPLRSSFHRGEYRIRTDGLLHAMQAL